VIGFMQADGSLIGDFVDAAIGHDVHSYTVPGLRSQLSSGHAIAITIGKSASGVIHVFGSGAFPAPDGKPLSQTFKELAKQLVE